MSYAMMSDGSSRYIQQLDERIYSDATPRDTLNPQQSSSDDESPDQKPKDIWSQKGRNAGVNCEQYSGKALAEFFEQILSWNNVPSIPLEVIRAFLDMGHFKNWFRENEHLYEYYRAEVLLRSMRFKPEYPVLIPVFLGEFTNASKERLKRSVKEKQKDLSDLQLNSKCLPKQADDFSVHFPVDHLSMYGQYSNSNTYFKPSSAVFLLSRECKNRILAMHDMITSAPCEIFKTIDTRCDLSDEDLKQFIEKTMIHYKRVLSDARHISFDNFETEGDIKYGNMMFLLGFQMDHGYVGMDLLGNDGIVTLITNDMSTYHNGFGICHFRFNDDKFNNSSLMLIEGLKRGLISGDSPRPVLDQFDVPLDTFRHALDNGVPYIPSSDRNQQPNREVLHIKNGMHMQPCLSTELQSGDK